MDFRFDQRRQAQPNGRSSTSVPPARRSESHTGYQNSDRLHSMHHRGNSLSNSRATTLLPATSSTPQGRTSRRSSISFGKPRQNFLRPNSDCDTIYTPSRFSSQRDDHDTDVDEQDLQLLANLSMGSAHDSSQNSSFSAAAPPPRRSFIPKSLSSQYGLTTASVSAQSPYKRYSLGMDTPLSSASVTANDSRASYAMSSGGVSGTRHFRTRSNSVWDDLESVKDRLRRMKVSQGIYPQDRETPAPASGRANNDYPVRQHQHQQSQPINANFASHYTNDYSDPSRGEHRPSTFAPYSSQVKKNAVRSVRPAERHLCEVLESLKRIRSILPDNSTQQYVDGAVKKNANSNNNFVGPSSPGFPLLLCMMEHSAADLLAIYPTIETSTGSIGEGFQLEALDKAALSLAGYILQFLETFQLSSLTDDSILAETEQVMDDSFQQDTLRSNQLQPRNQEQDQYNNQYDHTGVSPHLETINSFSSFGITNPPVAASSSVSSINTSTSNSSSLVSECHNQTLASANSASISSTNTTFNNLSPSTSHQVISKTRNRLGSMSNNSGSFGLSVNGGNGPVGNGAVGSHGFHLKNVANPSSNANFNGKPNFGKIAFDYNAMDSYNRDNNLGYTAGHPNNSVYHHQFQHPVANTASHHINTGHSMQQQQQQHQQHLFASPVYNASPSNPYASTEPSSAITTPLGSRPNSSLFRERLDRYSQRSEMSDRSDQADRINRLSQFQRAERRKMGLVPSATFSANLNLSEGQMDNNRNSFGSRGFNNRSKRHSITFV